MKHGVKHLLGLLCIGAFFLTKSAQAQEQNPNLIQISGVTMTADSLRGIPGVNVVVYNRHAGTSSNYQGVFSLVVFKGDTLEFSAVGFRKKLFVISPNVEGNRFSMIQLMTMDTFYLPETIIKPLPSRQEFEYAFLNEPIPDDKFEVARRNTEDAYLKAVGATLARDGRESQAVYQNLQAQKVYYYGQQPPMRIFSPMAWAEFFQSWKRGDFRSKK